MRGEGAPPADTDGDVCARVEALADSWRGRAARAEHERTLPRETVDELLDTGLLSLAAPARHGGPGSGWPTLAEAARRAARACASTGWTIGVVGGHAALAGRLSPEASELLFAKGVRQVFSTASAPADGRITRVPGGFEVAGRWRFCSAVDHATWVVLNGWCQSPSTPERVLVPLRADQVRVEDGWHVSGMSATGSKNIRVDSVFVAEALVTPVDACFGERWPNASGPTSGAGPGTGSGTGSGSGAGAEFGAADYLGGVPFLHYMNSLVIGPLMGCAEGAFDHYAASLSARDGGRSRALDDPLVQDALTESAAELACARHLYDSVCATLHSAGVGRRALTAREGAVISRDRAYLARLCVRAVQRLVQLAGTAAHHDASALARHWRDLQMMAAHRDVSWALNFPAYAALTIESGGAATVDSGAPGRDSAVPAVAEAHR
ncbi:acyl-CoA dehydrogenase family protein [Streptomyces sp. 891-h]|uniref:acyl-CoA dehydrogenase family protein n=1 Tax=Streptomyces sp. 891-h TaxID=2720714 RepID=UPI001FAB00D2|nr:acyl-CoA dehydrogenase family protein [Streptomyces sp. 891-h]UNZ21047.1 acyl-CoA dehydrogenase [Streptomyces sp. 891-h]